MGSKKWYKSKTIDGLGVPLVALGMAILNLPELKELIASLPAEYIGYASLGVGIATVVLRWATDKAVEW